MQRDGQPLFVAQHLDLVLDARRTKMQAAIAGLDPNLVTHKTADELAQRFVAEYSIAPVELHLELAGLEQPQETLLGGRHDRQVPAIRCEHVIPFGGDATLFNCVRSGGSYRGTVMGSVERSREGHILRMSWAVTRGERDQLKHTMDADIREVRHQIAESNKVVARFNAELENIAKACIGARREKVVEDASFVASLGYRLKRHDNIPPGFAVSLEQKTIRPMAKPPGAAGPPEPFLAEADYDAVLDALMGMSVAMERSPHAFSAMREEEIRFILLVPLNVIFKGEAAGEAFNYRGKTDILLLAGGRPVFIAECMVWDGPRSLLDKIEQLRGYATWRDTRLALIVFSRRSGFTAVLEKIDGTIEQAPGFRRRTEYAASSAFRCVITHRDDAQREMVLTILAFDVPQLTD